MPTTRFHDCELYRKSYVCRFFHSIKVIVVERKAEANFGFQLIKRQYLLGRLLRVPNTAAYTLKIAKRFGASEK